MSSTITLLWPWLSLEKRKRIGATLDAVPALWCTEQLGEAWRPYAEAAHGTDERCAWAAGFFEGDGSIGAYPIRRGSRTLVLHASMNQASMDGAPTSLLRFRDIVGAGSMSGPIQPPGWSRLPQYRWQAQGKSVEIAMAVLASWLVGAKREQVERAVAAVRTLPQVE